MKKLLLRAILFLIMVNCTACSNEPKFTWSDKSANFIGDSITSTGEYAEQVKLDLDLSSTSIYGIGGSSLCLRNEELDSNYSPLVNRWNDIEDADLLFILIGTNDYSSQVPLGNSDSTLNTEFNGCLNIVLEGLKEKFPDKLIVISSILKRKDNGVSIPVTEYNVAIESKANQYGIVFFDGFNAEGLDIGSDFDGLITADNLHPNSTGAKLLGQKIAEFLNTVKHN